VLERHGMSAEVIHKVAEGYRPNVVDLMHRGEIALVFNTPEDVRARQDSYMIRRTAVMQNIPYYLTVDGAQAAVGAIDIAVSSARIALSGDGGGPLVGASLLALALVIPPAGRWFGADGRAAAQRPQS
jgi:hypothetical protein